MLDRFISAILEIYSDSGRLVESIRSNGTLGENFQVISGGNVIFALRHLHTHASYDLSLVDFHDWKFSSLDTEADLEREVAKFKAVHEYHVKISLAVNDVNKLQDTFLMGKPIIDLAYELDEHRKLLIRLHPGKKEIEYYLFGVISYKVGRGFDKIESVDKLSEIVYNRLAKVNRI